MSVLLAQLTTLVIFFNKKEGKGNTRTFTAPYFPIFFFLLDFQFLYIIEALKKVSTAGLLICVASSSIASDIVD